MMTREQDAMAENGVYQMLTLNPIAIVPPLCSDHVSMRPRAWSRRVAIDLVAFGDVGLVVISGLLASGVLACNGTAGVDWAVTAQGSLVAALFNYLCLRHFGFYNIDRISDLEVAPVRLAAALAIGFAAALGVGMPNGLDISRFAFWYGSWALVSALLLLSLRCLARRLFAAATTRGHFDTRIAIYGSGPVGDRIARYIQRGDLGMRLVGIFDDRNSEARIDRSVMPIAGSLADLILAGRTGEVDRIVIAIPPTSDRRLADVARRLEQLPSSLHVVTHFAADIVDDAPLHAVSSLGPIGLIDIKTKPLGDWGPHVKMVEDLCIGAAALVVAAPVMAVIAVLIKLDSPGPVFFSQRRHGLNRRVIAVLKFRTMRVLEDGGDVRQATADDPRVTGFGRFLRSSSLDELPQLVNVLKGEMSLVGPRPHALVHDDQYDEMLERYANRHRVKPGMTGLAQIRGFRGLTDTPEKMRARVESDLEYIDTWSLWLDLRILGLTTVLGFKNKNAH